MFSGGPHVINSLPPFHFRPNWADTKTVGLTEVSLLHLVHFSLLLYNQTKSPFIIKYKYIYIYIKVPRQNLVTKLVITFNYNLTQYLFIIGEF